jgi:hypothetical protein
LPIGNFVSTATRHIDTNRLEADAIFRNKFDQRNHEDNNGNPNPSIVVDIGLVSQSMTSVISTCQTY